MKSIFVFFFRKEGFETRSYYRRYYRRFFSVICVFLLVLYIGREILIIMLNFYDVVLKNYEKKCKFYILNVCF